MAESILKNWNFTRDGLYLIRFLENVAKVMETCQTASLIELIQRATSEYRIHLKRETKKQTNLLGGDRF